MLSPSVAEDGTASPSTTLDTFTVEELTAADGGAAVSLR